MSNPTAQPTGAQSDKALGEKIEPGERSEPGAARLSPLKIVEKTGALYGIMPLLMAILAIEVRRLTVSVTQAVATGRHYARCYAEDREIYAAAFNPSVFDPASYDDLSNRAEGLWEADLQLEQAEENAGEVTESVEQGRVVKRRLVRTAEYLWGEDKKKMETIAGIKSGNSHMNLADDLFVLHHLFADNREDACKRSDVTLEEIDHARELGNKILDAVGPSRDEQVAEARDVRDRAGEYLRRGIEDIRAAAGFLFRNDHMALSRYPSLFTARKKRRSGAKKAEEATKTIPSAKAADTRVISAPSHQDA